MLKNTLMKKLIILLFPLIFFGQTSETNFISDNLSTYFELDRENIHLHLNKTVYLSNETIWFKGYVLDKKTKKLNPNTTNVFVTLYNENKEEIDSKLFFCSNGTISGYFPLNKSYKSGNYYLHVFTNYMNNFKENESSLFKISIINQESDNIILYNEKEIENVDIVYEGGSFLFESENNIYVSVKNCLGKGLKLDHIKVVDENNTTVMTFSTNLLGFGKFSINNPKNINYKIVFNDDDSTKNILLKKPTITGYNLHINNFSIANNTYIKILTNKHTLNNNKDKKLKLIVQQNENANIIDISLEDLVKKEISLSNEYFFKGLNNIFLIDNENNLLSERSIFQFENKINPITITKVIKKKDSLQIKGLIKNKYGNLSISALPVNNTSDFDNHSNIIASLLIDSYLENKILNTNYYFDNTDRRKQYELDLFIATNKPKYTWESIIGIKPKNKFNFDIGLNVTGKINQKLSQDEKEKLKLQLFSFNTIKESTEINDKNEFIFKNVLIEDSTSYYFSLIKKGQTFKPLNIYSTIEGNKRVFNNSIPIKPEICKTIAKNTLEKNVTLNEFPSVEKTIILDSISLIGKAKEQLVNKKYYGNVGATGYKIDDDVARSYIDVLSFIQSHGYDVSQVAGNVTIVSRSTRTLSGTNSPLLFIDNVPTTDFNLLYNLSLRDIDEIYINKRGYAGGLNAYNGIIRIYTKKSYSRDIEPDLKSKKMIVTNGFQKNIPFKNLKYLNVTNDAFKTYGTIDWIPSIYTDEKGEFEITIPHYYQNEIRLNIQGIDEDGSLHFLDTTIQVMN